MAYMNEIGAKAPVMNIAIGDAYIPHGNVGLLKKQAGIDADSIVKKILEAICEGVRHPATKQLSAPNGVNFP